MLGIKLQLQKRAPALVPVQPKPQSFKRGQQQFCRTGQSTCIWTSTLRRGRAHLLHGCVEPSKHTGIPYSLIYIDKQKVLLSNGNDVLSPSKLHHSNSSNHSGLRDVQQTAAVCSLPEKSRSRDAEEAGRGWKRRMLMTVQTNVECNMQCLGYFLSEYVIARV